MYKVVLYYDEFTFDIDFERYCEASIYLSKIMKEDDDIMLGKIYHNNEEIKVISNIGYYDEVNKIIYGYYR